MIYNNKMRDMKKFLLLIICILLIAGPVACGKAGAPAAVKVDGAEIPPFSFMVEDTEITDAVMAAYPVYSVETTSTNTYGTTTTRVYVGYAMSDVLEAAGITEAFSTLVTLADDGYTVSVSKDVAMKPTTLTAISEDGKVFKKGLWFAPCVSDVSPDYLRDLALITLKD